MSLVPEMSSTYTLKVVSIASKSPISALAIYELAGSFKFMFRTSFPEGNSLEPQVAYCGSPLGLRAPSGSFLRARIRCPSREHSLTGVTSVIYNAILVLPPTGCTSQRRFTLSGHPEGALPVLGCCMMCLVMATPLQRERPPLLVILQYVNCQSIGCGI